MDYEDYYPDEIEVFQGAYSKTLNKWGCLDCLTSRKTTQEEQEYFISEIKDSNNKDHYDFLRAHKGKEKCFWCNSII